MHLEIVTPEKTVFSGEVTLVQLPGEKGSFEILHNHAPIISSLKAGTVKYITKEGITKNVEINGGVVESRSNNIVVLGEFI
ncbi:MAG: ATP synthase F1 subunit epsilon [Chlorobi bacterium]|nr:ATP synthase F1 subunit epsilon [Chlorobiota bacterium]